MKNLNFFEKKWTTLLLMVAMPLIFFTCDKVDDGRDQHQHDQDQTETIVDMVFVEGDTFNIGFRTTILSNYYINKYEITQSQWKAVMGENPSYFIGDNLPIEHVSWYDCIEFCNALSIKEGLTPYYTIDKNTEDVNNLSYHDDAKWTITTNSNAKGYRLPTEMEWIFAACGGTKSKGNTYSGSNDLASIGWYYENSNNETHPVGQKQANELLLYDMTGNVNEWCWDWYDELGSGTHTNPTGPSSGSYRVYCGGSWNSDDLNCWITTRNSDIATNRGFTTGLRVARNF